MTKHFLKTIPVFLLLVATACSFSKGKGAAEAAVAQFHNQYNAGQFHDIYSQAHEGFRNASEANTTQFFEALKQKLGSVKQANQTSWHVNATTGGTMVTLAYDVEFTEGKGAEQFVFRVDGSRALLYKYHVESPLLITK